MGKTSYWYIASVQRLIEFDTVHLSQDHTDEITSNKNYLKDQFTFFYLFVTM